MERDNRKSHLAPQLSPATQDLLRTSDSPTFQTQSEDRMIHYAHFWRDSHWRRRVSFHLETPKAGHPVAMASDPAERRQPRIQGWDSRVATTNSIPQTSKYSESTAPGSAKCYYL